ncbi:MAG TPA: prephenate dehydratase [bacterium]|nr:prephenate dehydratase [bacterium]
MDLKKMRDKINQIDSEIIKAINERARFALEIGKIKIKNNQDIYSPEREKEVYARICAENKGPVRSDSLVAIYREIMSGALALEKELVIAYLGPQATFTHQAALNKFGSSVKYISMKNITDVFTEVEKGYADYGVVPIENSTEGIITHTLDMFIDSDLKIYSEVYLEIGHNLMSLSENLENIRKIYSKAEVFGQCRSWLHANMPNVELAEVSSTTRAAQLAREEQGAGAIASRLAATVYGLHLVAQGIEDSAHNVTRFLVIGRRYGKRTRDDKTSLMFSIKDRVGALYETLLPFRKNKINLTKIESRPSKRKAWEYYFFVDLVGHCEDAKVKKAIAELSKAVHFVKILGSYPKSRLREGV